MEKEEKDVKKERKVIKRDRKLSRKSRKKRKINFATVLQIFDRKSDKKKGKIAAFLGKKGRKKGKMEKKDSRSMVNA